MKRLVNVVEVVAVLATLLFVVMLFANEPDSGGGGDGGPLGPAEIYASNCAGCHGADGDGGTGPQLSGGAVVEAYPDVEDQIAVVTDGKGVMPSFEGRLSEQEIREVVDYTRTL